MRRVDKEEAFVKSAKQLARSIKVLIDDMKHSYEKESVAEQIADALRSLGALCKDCGFLKMEEFVGKSEELIYFSLSDSEALNDELNSFIEEILNKVVELLEKIEEKNLDILEKADLDGYKERISAFLKKKENVPQKAQKMSSVRNSGNVLAVMPAEKRELLKKLLKEGRQALVVLLEADRSGIEVDVLKIVKSLEDIGEIAYAAVDARNLPPLEKLDLKNPYITPAFVVVTDKSADEIKGLVKKEEGIRLSVTELSIDEIEKFESSKDKENNAASCQTADEEKINEILDMVLRQQEKFYEIATNQEERSLRGKIVTHVLQKVAEFMGWIAKGESIIESFRRNKDKWPKKFTSLFSRILNSGMEEKLEEKKAFKETQAVVGKPQAKKTLLQPVASVNTRGGNNNGTESQRIVSKTLKVDQSKIDQLMNLVGELVVVNNGLSFILKKLETNYGSSELTKELKQQQQLLSRIGNNLQDIVMGLRILPIRYVFERVPRMVRDISRQLNKKVNLITEGEETQVDKNIVTALYDPMLHIIRNAIDHGIETPQERLKAGKPAEGTIILKAWRGGDRVIVEVRDDGRGIDPDDVRAKAVEKGFVSLEEAAAMDDEAVLELLFMPGFSTSEKVTELSGRGVGMDVIRDTVRNLGGNVRIVSKPGEGTSIFMELPITMVTSRVLLVTLGGQHYAFPLESVREMVKIRKEEIRSIKGREIVVLRQKIMPLLRLCDFLGIEDKCLQKEDRCSLVVLGCDVAVMVDDFIGEQEIIIKPLSEEFSSATCFLGAAVLGDGSIVLVLNPEELVPSS